MKFIFPQNYNFKNKLFGIIDYSSLIFNIIWNLIIFLLVNLLFKNNNIKIFIFIIFSLHIFLFTIFGFNHENILNVFIYLIKYIKRPKIYFYSKCY